MELSQGKTVDITAFQKMIDGNFGTGIANGIITGTTYIIKVQDSRTYAMSSDGNIAKLDKYPIDDNPGILEQSGNMYTINSIEDLVAFSYNVNSSAESYEGKTVTLGRNLDFKDDMSYVDANSKYKKDDNGYVPDTTSTRTIKDLMINTEDIGFIPVGKDVNNTFKGNFDGKGKSLSNMYINTSSLGGLFGVIQTEMSISKVSLISCDIKGSGPTGALIGSINKALTVDSVYVSGKVESTSAMAGGIIGINDELRITNCSNESNVKAQSGAGGITFGTYNSPANVIILNCHNAGRIESLSVAGGIAGAYIDEIINCYNTGDVIASSVAGGISYYADFIVNCYNKGKVESVGSVAGGINGNSGKTITNCYNDGEVKGKNESGGISCAQLSSITNCYNFKPVTSASGSVGGIAPLNCTVDNCYNSGTITTGVSSPAGGISAQSSTITNSHNSGNIIGENSSQLGEIIGYGNVDNTNNYLIKDNNATNISNAVGKTQEQMTEIMSVQNFVNLMNSYVSTNNSDSTKTKLKTWKVENGLPVFVD